MQSHFLVHELETCFSNFILYFLSLFFFLFFYKLFSVVSGPAEAFFKRFLVRCRLSKHMHFTVFYLRR